MTQKVSPTVTPGEATKVDKAYHHGDLRSAILEAACEHLRHDNADTLSLRALAREIGVSQTAPYRHFDSRNALFAGIATWGFEILEKRLKQSMLGIEGGPVEMMIETGISYLQFAVDHSEKYQMFFDSSLVDFDEYPELQAAGSRCFEVLLGLIRQGRQAGVYRDEPEEHLAAIVWSGLHGMASLIQIDHAHSHAQERSTHRAIKFLSEQRRDALKALLSAILK